jgi:hypothetical protein
MIIVARDIHLQWLKEKHFVLDDFLYTLHIFFSLEYELIYGTVCFYGEY